MAGQFEKWPTHSNDPYIPPHKINKTLEELRLAKSSFKSAPLDGPWYNQARGRTMPTISVLNKNLNTAVNKKNWRTAKPVTYTREFLY